MGHRPVKSRISVTALPLVATALIAALLLASCEEAPTPTVPPEPTASPTPTDEPLLHVPGTFGESANSTTRESERPFFLCGPFLWNQLEYTPEVLLWTPDGSNLVFSRGGNIWTVDRQGAKLKQVLRALGGTTPVLSLGFQFGFHADLSPDGTRLAYTSCQFRDEEEDADYAQSVIAKMGTEWFERGLYTYQIALTGLDGGNQQRITYSGAINHYPVWSPQGDRIVFYTGNEWLHTISPDGSEAPERVIDMKVARVPPAWSPDGQRLAFVVNERGESNPPPRNVYTVRPDGSDLVKVGRIGGGGWLVTAAPAWHPDGERLAFAGYDGGEQFVRTVRFDGSDLRPVWYRVPDPESKEVSQVSWSPDGSELLLVADGVYIVHPDGGTLRKLYALAAGRYTDHTVASWSPDGSRIAIYTTGRGIGPSPSASLVIINRDGTNLRVLVEADEDDPLRVVQANQPEDAMEPAVGSPTPVPTEPTATPGEE